MRKREKQNLVAISDEIKEIRLHLEAISLELEDILDQESDAFKKLRAATQKRKKAAHESEINDIANIVGDFMSITNQLDAHEKTLTQMSKGGWYEPRPSIRDRKERLEAS